MVSPSTRAEAVYTLTMGRTGLIVCFLLALAVSTKGQFQLVFGTNGPPAATVAPGGFDSSKVFCPHCIFVVVNVTVVDYYL